MYPKEIFRKSKEFKKIGYFRFRELVPDVLADSVVYWRCPLFSVYVYHVGCDDAVLQLVERYRYKGEEQFRPHIFCMSMSVASLKLSECVDWYLCRNLFLRK